MIGRNRNFSIGIDQTRFEHMLTPSQLSETLSPDIMKPTNRTKIAIPMAQGLFCEHFGGAKEFIIAEGDDRTGHLEEIQVFTAPKHEPGSLPRWLEKQNVDLLVAGSIGEKALIMLSNAGIHVVLANDTREPSELASAALSGSLIRANIENSQCNGHHDHDGHECHHH